jgi:hypothetical protein
MHAASVFCPVFVDGGGHHRDPSHDVGLFGAFAILSKPCSTLLGCGSKRIEGPLFILD